MNKSRKIICSIPYYQEDQYQRLKELSIDKETFSASYAEHIKITESKYKEMERKGFRVVKIIVNIEELIEWTKSRNLRINAESRTRFALEKLKEMISNKAIKI